MLDALKRLLLDGARPIDRTILVVDLLVLLVIVAEWIHGSMSERKAQQKARRRAEELQQRMATLQGVMREGVTGEGSRATANERSCVGGFCSGVE